MPIPHNIPSSHSSTDFLMDDEEYCYCCIARSLCNPFACGIGMLAVGAGLLISGLIHNNIPLIISGSALLMLGGAPLAISCKTDDEDEAFAPCPCNTASRHD